MAINATYYLDGANLSVATAVYLDAGLTYVAPDGFYRNGTVVRQQSTGILLDVDTCEECADCIRYIATTEEFTGGADYTDCSGVPQTITLGINQTTNFCAEEGSVTPSGGVLISLSATPCP
jgi:hypothetical protein